MKEIVKVSVRELVAFSYFCPHIMPAADMDTLLTGAKAHRIRQGLHVGETEKSIKHVYEFEDIQIQVYGRMDAFTDGDIPLIEEIKLCNDEPEKAREEHRAQVICYASMLAVQNEKEEIAISVCYVNADGDFIRSFDETLSREQLEEEMRSLLKPFIQFVRQEQDHRAKRDESLKQLAFPFAQYRKGQRELAAQVYTAITRKKRLFASLPTGTGKSAAVLYPSLKAMGNGLTERIVYLTSRNTARQSPLNALEKMLRSGLVARCSVVTAKEKMCPAQTRCHPDDCPRANGHYLRQGDAINELLQLKQRVWDEQAICAVADNHMVCPFELSLALSEISDVLMMDLNYAFDPFAQLKRLFQKQQNFTLLVDEAHHTVDRTRDNLSGCLNSAELAQMRMEYGKLRGRKNTLYRVLSKLIQALRALPCEEAEMLSCEPADITALVQEVQDAAIKAGAQDGGALQPLIRITLAYLYAHEHLDEDYAILLEANSKERILTLYCTLPAKAIGKITQKLSGTVFFSATLQPLNAMKQLLGGSDSDACFALPSPFPTERLRIVRKAVNTRYQNRENSAAEIASLIHETLEKHRGNTIAFFPSYAYMNKVAAFLEPESLPDLWIQTKDMGEDAREAFLEAFEETGTTKLGLCVLGGLFSEGIDLPGDRLVNVIIIGVGLPVPSLRVNAIRLCYQKHFSDGFTYACLIPGMQKVLQAAGRVIRSEHDKGMVVLVDDRYEHMEYKALLPEAWNGKNETIAQAAAKLEEMN